MKKPESSKKIRKATNNRGKKRSDREKESKANNIARKAKINKEKELMLHKQNQYLEKILASRPKS